LKVRARLVYRRAWRALVDAKQWTTDGHGKPLADIAPPHFGHLMEQAEATFELPYTGPEPDAGPTPDGAPAGGNGNGNGEGEGGCGCRTAGGSTSAGLIVIAALWAIRPRRRRKVGPAQIR